MKILYAGYRDWALKALDTCNQNELQLTPGNKCHIKLVTEPEVLIEELESDNVFDFVFLAGWSWIVPKLLCSKHFIVGVHPSDLPMYAGGSPIQHQILDGISKTKMSIFRITPEIDAGGILYKTNLNLDGNMEDIFMSLQAATVNCLDYMINNWPNITESKQEHKMIPLKRLKPEDGKLTVKNFKSMNAKELYDFIRCREYPYPNAYIEDESGKLLIERCHFLHNEKIKVGTRVKLNKWFIKQLDTTQSTAHGDEFKEQIGTVIGPMFPEDPECLIMNVMWDSNLRYGYHTNELDIVEE